jgi:hypothetical protein
VLLALLLFITPRDIAKYQESVKAWNIPSLNERFEMLRQLGNVFLVKPEILPSVLNEGYLAKVDFKSLYPYLQMRVDFKTSKIDKLFEKFNLTNNSNGNGSGPASGGATSRMAQLEELAGSKFLSYSLHR